MLLLAPLGYAFSVNVDLSTDPALLEIIANGPHTLSWEVYLRWAIHALAAIKSSQMINPRCLSPAVKEFISSAV